MRKILTRMGTVMASLALLVTAANMNATCMIVAHQPKLPEAAEKLRRF